MWLHIDAAYGGGFAIVSEYEWLRDGWDMADSVVINPHKTVFVPLDFSVLYVRDLERLRRVFTLVPEVLRGDTIEGEKNYMDYGIQLGRRFRALKAWVIWRALGRAGIVAGLREQIRLANLFSEWIERDDRFELAAPVSMGVVCFRWVGSARCGDRTPQRASLRSGQAGPIEQRHGATRNASRRAYLTQKIARTNRNANRPRKYSDDGRASAQSLGDHHANGRQPVAASRCEAHSYIFFDNAARRAATDLRLSLAFAR